MEADIAGVRVRLAGPTAWMQGVLGARYRPFPARSAVDAAHTHFPSLTVEIDVDERPGPMPPREANGMPPDYPLSIEREGDVVRVRGWWLDGRIDLSAETATARVSAHDAAGSTENFLRVAIAHLLLPSGGFLLHAAAVLSKDGRATGARGAAPSSPKSAIVCFGPSGAGKSTLAGLSGGRTVISDDLVALVRVDAELRVIPTPFRAVDAPAFPAGHPVRALFRLRHGARGGAPSIRPLDPVRAAIELTGSMPFVHDDGSTSAAALALAAKAASDPGVRELAFAPDPDVWNRLEASS